MLFFFFLANRINYLCSCLPRPLRARARACARARFPISYFLDKTLQGEGDRARAGARAREAR
jgi:hypothetical protein